MKNSNEIIQNRLLRNKLLIPAILAVCVIGVIILLLFRGISKQERTSEIASSEGNSIHFTKEDYQAADKKILKVSNAQPEATAFKATISFGEYALESEKKLEVKRLPEKLLPEDGLKLTAYDFTLEGQTEFEDVLTITIPYDSEYVEQGAEGECVGAKYYNEETAEWEGVYYELDVKKEQVIIYTTHLSTYGLFQIKNENTRKAYITDVYAISKLVPSEQAYRVLNEYNVKGETGNAAFEAGFKVINGVVGDIGTSVTLATLGGQYDGALVSKLGSAFSHTGLALSTVQTCYDFYYNYDSEEGKKETIINLVKNLANNAVGYFGSASLQVGFAGIYVFDVLLSTVQEDMVELKLENIGEVYQYYNDVENPRSNKEWRRLFIKLLEQNKQEPEKAQQLIESEIDAYCNRFWELSYEKQKEIAGVAGKKVMFEQNKEDIKTLTAQYKVYLMTKLQAPLTSARNYLLNKAMEAARKNLETELRKLQAELNQQVTVQIIEEPEEGEELKYSGYTLRIGPLSDKADVEDWSGLMPEGGTLNLTFTLLGYMQCGSPGTVELYQPGDDNPVLTAPFQLSYPITTVYLKSKGKDDLQESETTEEATEAPKDTSLISKELTWVLVETKVIDNQDKLKEQNETQEGIYSTELISATPGNISSKWTYLGETDTYYDPDVINGESATSQTTFDAPPSTIKGEETVTLSIAASIPAQNLSYYNATATGRADLCYLDQNGEFTGDYVRFADGNGKNFIEAFASPSRNEFYSDEATVSAVMPSGGKEGDKISIEISGGGAWNVTVQFIYEWKAD